MTIALIGHGRMGMEVETVARERRIPIGRIFTEEDNTGAVGLTRESLRGIDVCIDFSSPASVVENIRAVATAGCDIVVGTTGWYEHLEEVRKLVGEKQTGFLYAANFSLGVNIFSEIVKDAARLVERHPGYDVAVSETHHSGKADSPSGTALALASLILGAFPRKSGILSDAAHGAIPENRLHVSSTRVGHVPGRHSVIFDSDADTIELTHTARNRRGFAFGALVAAEWLKGKKGFFTMRDVILA
jgi:4-hydroxy-tetrahydrodipicolinate reductase